MNNIINKLPKEFSIKVEKEGEDKKIVDKLSEIGIIHTWCGFSGKGSYYIIKNGREYNCSSINPIGTIYTFPEFLSLLESFNEKWVECVELGGNNNLTLRKKYKILREDSSIGSKSYWIINDDGVEGEYWTTRFKEINNMEKEEIIGYKAPFDMFNGDIKKDHLFIKVPGDNGYYPLNHSTLYKNLPREIVETWTPVYKSKEITLSIGNPSKTVKISKGKIECERRSIYKDKLDSIYNTYFGNNKLGDWNVKADKIVIGCSIFSKEDLEKIIYEYSKLNK